MSDIYKSVTSLVEENGLLTSRYCNYIIFSSLLGIMSLDDDNLISKSSLELAFRTFQVRLK